MTEEKKLTDEEVLKALRFKAEHDAKVGYLDGCAYKVIRVADILDLIHRLQSENKRLTREVDKQKNFATAWEESWKIANEQNTKIRVKLKKENTELQKQVDELKKQFLSTCENCHLKKDIELLSYQKQQAVKDTAKEILQEVGNIVDDGDDRFKYKDYQWHKNLCKHYGVEVE